MDEEEVVTLLSSETRLRIVRALGDLSEREEFSILTFSTLQEAVGVTDSGNFNYHLSKLVPTLVERCEEGYKLSLDGVYLYQTLVKLDYPEAAYGPYDIDLDCIDCENPMSVWVDGGRGYFGCESCEHVDIRYPIPAGGIHRISHADPPEQGEVIYRTLMERKTMDQHLMLRGFCPYCSGAVSPRLTERAHLLPNAEDARQGVIVSLHCPFCHWFVPTNLEGAIPIHPAVMPFLQRQGVDTYTQDPTAAYDAAIDLRSTDPWRIDVRVTCGDAELDLTFDGEFTVVED